MNAGALALQAAALFGIDPQGLAGVWLRARPGPARERWLALLNTLLPQPPRRLPVHIDDHRLLGGLDLAATLRSGRPVQQPGLLAECNGGVLGLAMAERMPPALAARLAAVIDTGRVVSAAGIAPARLALVALDEGVEDDETLPASLADRLAIHLRLDEGKGKGKGDGPVPTAAQIAAARERLPAVEVGEALQRQACEAAALLGIDSLRAPLLALRVMRAAAALAGRTQVTRDDLDLALHLVLAPRARHLPVPPQAEPPAAPPPEQEAGPNDSDDDSPVDPDTQQPLDEQVLDAAQSVLPAGLLQLLAGGGPRRAPPSSGRVGTATLSRRRGRPIGSERGLPKGGARLDLVATLRAAAPWQPLRRRESGATQRTLHLQRDDLHVRRCKTRRETTTIFAVDASGSAALHRLAEAKGAVELLLADCYVRRDRVALIAFRGAAAELLLPPTRSLPRAKRCLAALPGGGGTPLAAGIVAAQALAQALQRQGSSPSLVLLTDGRANIARDGSPGREGAHRDALAAARQLRDCGLPALLIDTSPQMQPAAQAVADAMGARYLALPHADALQLSRAAALSLAR